MIPPYRAKVRVDVQLQVGDVLALAQSQFSNSGVVGNQATSVFSSSFMVYLLSGVKIYKKWNTRVNNYPGRDSQI